MVEIDPLTGLPKELGVWENIAKESQEIQLFTIKKKFGKINTVVEGLDPKQIDIKDLGKKLKSAFACGGTAKNGKIELQGNHRNKVKQELIKLGYPENSIKIK
jgi:translation initiation factor 1